MLMLTEVKVVMLSVIIVDSLGCLCSNMLVFFLFYRGKNWQISLLEHQNLSSVKFSCEVVAIFIGYFLIVFKQKTLFIFLKKNSILFGKWIYFTMFLGLCQEHKAEKSQGRGEMMILKREDGDHPDLFLINQYHYY